MGIAEKKKQLQEVKAMLPMLATASDPNSSYSVAERLATLAHAMHIMFSQMAQYVEADIAEDIGG